MMLYALVIALTVFTVLDLDNPRFGLIRLNAADNALISCAIPSLDKTLPWLWSQVLWSPSRVSYSIFCSADMLARPSRKFPPHNQHERSSFTG